MAYPATFTFEAPEKVARWRPFLQWIMVIPHVIIASMIGFVASLVSLLAWFAIMFTGKLPLGIAGFLCMSIRYQTRITAYSGFLHVEYPPFDFETTAADPGGQPIRVDFEPVLEGRNRLTVLFRVFLIIPAWIFLFVINLLAYILWSIAFFAVLFTGKWPAGMLNFVNGTLRVNTRFSAYNNLLTDEYPPFEMN